MGKNKGDNSSGQYTSWGISNQYICWLTLILMIK